MALFVLGDTNLSLGASKPRIFFPGWNDYVERLEKNLAQAHQTERIPLYWRAISAGPCA